MIEDSSGEDGDEPSEQGVNKMEEEYEYSDEHSDEEVSDYRVNLKMCVTMIFSSSRLHQNVMNYNEE